MQTGTIEISAEQAGNVIDHVKTNKNVFAMTIPKTNGCINLQNGITLRKLPVKFRGGNVKSMAFRLKGPLESMREIMKYVNPDNNRSVQMTIKDGK